MWLLKQLDVFTDSFIGQTELSFGLECLHPQQVILLGFLEKHLHFTWMLFFLKQRKVYTVVCFISLKVKHHMFT